MDRALGVPYSLRQIAAHSAMRTRRPLYARARRGLSEKKEAEGERGREGSWSRGLHRSRPSAHPRRPHLGEFGEP